MFQLTSGTVLVNGLQIHFYRGGTQGKPPLVMVHGITDDGLCWTPVARKLADRFELVLVDLRGHGRSDAPADGYSFQALATDLAALIRFLGLDRPFLLGHSMGAMTSLVLTSLFPEIPRALLLEDPPAFWMPRPPRSEGDGASTLLRWIDANKRKTRDELQMEAHMNTPNWSEEEVEPWINAKHRYSPSIASMVDPDDVDTLDFPQSFGAIVCPTLLIHAEPARGGLIGVPEAAALQKLIPQLQVEYIPGAGHNIRRDQPAAYLRVIEQALS